MPGLVEGVPATGEQPSCSAKMGMLPCRSCTPLLGIGLVLDSSRVVFLLPPSPGIAVPVAAGRGEGGGRAVSVSVEAAVPGAPVAGCDALRAADSVGAGGPGCCRPALSLPRAASALHLHRATSQGLQCQPESGGAAAHESGNESSSERPLQTSSTRSHLLSTWTALPT